MTYDPVTKRVMDTIGVSYRYALSLVQRAQQLAEWDQVSYAEAEERVLQAEEARFQSRQT